ncbi:hypothetical protein GH714_012090 [Hevea brasiliensis]|uniref:RNase H type-1 domain-containing protein n=1 Tax=Hevea brasiliensis TaxID=3981 RepID=A0A6A6LII5_HEVBR|nr:hypothetical protein GH714_012090 [Hevea brasiliensis]
MACKEALFFISDKQHHGVTEEGDCKIIMDAINNNAPPTAIFSLVHDINEIYNSLNDILFTFVKREGLSFNRRRLYLRKVYDTVTPCDFREYESSAEGNFVVAFKGDEHDPERRDWSGYYGYYRALNEIKSSSLYVLCLSLFLFTFSNKYRESSFPTPAGWVKLNTSGKGSDESSPAGYGGIFQNENNETLAIYNGSLGEMDAISASLEAIRHGFRCLKTMPDVKNLIVEGDNLSVIGWVNRCPEPPARIQETLGEIFADSRSINCAISHVYEEANHPAIALAEKGSMLENAYVWISNS